MTLLNAKKLHISPVDILKGDIRPPASKSTSVRAVLAATLAQGESKIFNIANSNNVRAMIKCCEVLGAKCVYEADDIIIINGPGFDNLNDNVTLDPGNSGIVLRLLMGATAHLKKVNFASKYKDSLAKRSNIEMINALQPLGVKCEWRDDDGKLPIHLDGSEIHGGKTSISARKSSQFLSGLLFLGGGLKSGLTITVSDELKAPDMVRTTIATMKRAGIKVTASEDFMSFEIEPNTVFHPTTHTIGSDPASTAALMAVASVVPSDIRLIDYQEEEMGNGAVVKHLQKLGVSIEVIEDKVHIKGGNPLKAADFDGSLAPDAVLPLAAVSAFAEGTSRFMNIEHIRYKECDRISDFRCELEKAGVRTEEKPDELIVYGSQGEIKGNADINGHYDHGVIMAMTAVALGSEKGLTICDPQHVAQTYPQFFGDLASIGGIVKPS